MSELVSWKNSVDGFEVEFEAISPVDFSGVKDERQLEILEGLQNVNERIRVNQDLINKLNADIDRLTNSADGLDYTIAVASGIIAGLIDSFFVGEFSIDNANDWGDKKVNNFVISVAQKQGYKGDDLQGAILFMEKKYGAPSDSVTSMFGGGKQHHLRDFAHHPTPVGLFFSMLTQFTSKAYGTDTAGMFIVVDVVNKSLIGDDLPKKILYGVVFWLFHMVSDMAGSNATAGAGTGLPGPLVSLVKELSVLPIFKNASINGTELSVWVSKLFNGTLLSKRDENGKILEAVKFDLRTEIGVAHEIGKQAIPVIINECIVRGFYFIRRFVMEIKANEIKRIGDLGKIDWKKTLPFKNRTIVRMLTISSLYSFFHIKILNFV